MGYCIIADIAGQYDTLLALLKQMPDEEPISVGDMIDRGPKSKEVVEFFMKHGSAIMGNHEHMAIDYYNDASYYPWNTWFYNGGHETVNSFAGLVAPEIVTWMEHLPKYIEVEGSLISHAFVHPGYSLEDVCDLGRFCDDQKGRRSILWHRGPPRRMAKYQMQIAGHNSQTGLRHFSDGRGEHSICLDASAQNVLTGIHLPSFTIYQQTFIQ